VRYRTWMFAAGLVGVVVLAGCTSTGPGRAEPAPADSPKPQSTASAPPTSGSATPSEDGLPSDGAPKVKNPLNTSRFQQNPCLALTAAQAQDLNVGTAGEQRQGPLGQACNWSNSETGGNADLQFGDKSPRGLSAVYRANKAGKYVYFVELPEIEGHPAVAFHIVDRRDKGECAVAVGVADRLSFQLALSLSRANIGQKDPCEVTVQVAGMMLRTMKAGG
jgi:hypothetical protein